jgi:hypothetical protein
VPDGERGIRLRLGKNALASVPGTADKRGRLRALPNRVICLILQSGLASRFPVGHNGIKALVGQWMFGQFSSVVVGMVVTSAVDSSASLQARYGGCPSKHYY